MWVAVRPDVTLKAGQDDVAAGTVPMVYHVHTVDRSGAEPRYLLTGEVSGWAKAADLMDPVDTLAAVAGLIRQSPCDPGLYLARGLVETGIGWYRPAIGDFDQALRLNPWSAVAYYHRAVAYDAMSQRERALGDLYEAIRLDPGNPAYYFARAVEEEHLHQTPRAIEDYTTALRLDPRNAQAKAGLDRLAPLHPSTAPTQGGSGPSGTGAAATEPSPGPAVPAS
jgi:tetratricopeptide (TPR) repeat protein